MFSKQLNYGVVLKHAHEISFCKVDIVLLSLFGKTRNTRNTPSCIPFVSQCIYDKFDGCVVAKGEEEGWICCDNCKGWLHEQCAGMPASRCKGEGEVYVCCASLQSHQERK